MRNELKTITLIVRDSDGSVSKITRQCSEYDAISEVIAILREMLLGLGYQPKSVDYYIHNI